MRSEPARVTADPAGPGTPHRSPAIAVEYFSDVKLFVRPLLAVMVAALLGPLLSPTMVSAEQPSLVISALENDGVFINNRRNGDVDRERLVTVVDDAAALGYRMAIVIPLDPLPDLRAFVLRVQQGGEFDVVLGFGLEGELEAETSDDLKKDRLSALAAARANDGGYEDVSELFLVELTTEPVQEIPGSVQRIIRWVIWLVVLLGLAIFAEWIWRSRSRRGKPASEKVPDRV